MIEDAVLEKYLSNQLTPEERTSFEAELDTNENLQLRLKILKSQKSFLKNKDAISNSKSAIHDISQKFRQQDDGKLVKKRNNLIYIIPSAIAALLLVGLFLRPLISATDTSTLYTEYFQPTELSLLTKSEANDELQQSAELSFNQKNYTEAIAHLNKLIEEDPTSQLYVYSLAVAKLGAGQNAQAISELEQFKSHPLYGSAAQWYSALAHLKMDNVDAAKSLLNNISSQSSYFSSARQLLKDLK